MSLQAIKINHNSLAEPDITNYWQHYGLSCDPFATELAEEFYFAVPRWEECLDLLQFLCHYNNVLLVVTGNSCSGKTTLAKQFCTQVHDSMRVSELKASSAFTTQQLIQTLSDQFQLPLNLQLSLEEQLDELIVSIQKSQKICLLLVDDAHLLSNQTLHSMLYLVRQQSESQMKLHFLLLGEPHLPNNLTRVCQAQGECEDLIHVINLGLLSLDETEKYLAYRLAKAGFTDAPLIQTVINRIYKLSGGAPGRINRIARRALLNDLTKRLPEVKESFISKNQTKLIGSLLFISMVAVFFMILDATRIGDSLALLKQQRQEIGAMPDKHLIPKLDDSNDQRVHAKPNAAALAGLSDTVAVNHTATTQSIAAIPFKPTVSKENITITSTTPVSTASVMAQDTQMLQATLAAARALPPLTKPVVMTPSKAASIKVKTIAPVGQPAGTNSSSAVRLSAIPASQYGLQLVGLSSEAAIKRFIADNKMADKANYYYTLRDGKAWYVIIYGQFNSSIEAKAAIGSLPEAVQALKPWVRSYASVHAAIDNAQNP